MSCLWLIACTWHAHSLFMNCSFFSYDSSMICLWLVHVFFIACSWLSSVYFISCSWLVYHLLMTHSLFVYDLCMTFYVLSPAHDLFTVCSWIVHSFPRLVHYLFTACSQFSNDLFTTGTCFVHFMTCSLLFTSFWWLLDDLFMTFS